MFWFCATPYAFNNSPFVPYPRPSYSSVPPPPHHHTTTTTTTATTTTTTTTTHTHTCTYTHSTRILALQNALRDIAQAIPSTIAALATERAELCRSISLLEDINRDVRQSGMDMVAQHKQLRLKKTIAKLA